VAVERLAGKAVLGEAPEDLDFTLEDLERVRKFLATTRRECPSERGYPARISVLRINRDLDRQRRHRRAGDAGSRLRSRLALELDVEHEASAQEQ